ncbi:MAG: hypothetical protein QXK94_09665 [Candidatus Jordarchaeales archaeon]
MDDIYKIARDFEVRRAVAHKDIDECFNLKTHKEILDCIISKAKEHAPHIFLEALIDYIGQDLKRDNYERYMDDNEGREFIKKKNKAYKDIDRCFGREPKPSKEILDCIISKAKEHEPDAFLEALIDYIADVYLLEDFVICPP